MSDAPGDPSQTDDDEDEAVDGEIDSLHPSDSDSQREGESEGAELAPERSSDRPRKRVKQSSKSSKSSRSSKSHKTGTAAASSAARAASPPSRSGSRGALFAAIALAVGVGAGWVLGASRTVAEDSAEAGPAPSGSAGPDAQCQTWSEEICTQVGAQSAACMQAKGASELLPAGACKAALREVPATVERVRVARLVCDTLVSRLCKDLGETSQTCQMVKSKTESFPPDRCQEMVDNYDQVIGQLKMIEQQGMRPPGAQPPGGMPVRMMPAGPAGPAPH